MTQQELSMLIRAAIEYGKESTVKDIPSETASLRKENDELMALQRKQDITIRDLTDRLNVRNEECAQLKKENISFKEQQFYPIQLPSGNILNTPDEVINYVMSLVQRITVAEEEIETLKGQSNVQSIAVRKDRDKEVIFNSAKEAIEWYNNKFGKHLADNISVMYLADLFKEHGYDLTIAIPL